MKKIANVILVTISSIIFLVPYRKVYAVPNPVSYDYHEMDHTIDQVCSDVIANMPVILFGSNNKKITLGNESVIEDCKSESITSQSLQSHHILFKGMRATFPGIPYVCMQTPKDHHKKYHRDKNNTNVDFSNFTNMRDYLYSLRASILVVARGKRDPYTEISIQAARIATKCQLYWIGSRYSWLYAVESGKYLLLAQRLLATNCFPNQVIVNKHICQQKVQYISEELALSNFVMHRISHDDPGSHLRQALRARMQLLSIYTANVRDLTSAEAFTMANKRYGHSARFYNPVRNIHNISNQFGGESSDASSLDN